MKILTITANPAVDLTVTLPACLTPGEVHRAEGAASCPGGKGVNVSAALAAYGVPNCAGGFLGAANADIFARYFAERGIGDLFLKVEGETRTNIKIVDPRGTTDVNLPGLAVTGKDTAALTGMVEHYFEETEERGMAVLSGSLPPGCDSGLYRRLTETLKARGCLTLVDADGEALKETLAGPVLPDVIKPNLKEFSEWAGIALKTFTGITEIAEKLVRRGLGLAAVSLGDEGALFVTAGGALHAAGRPARMASTVGAGDAMMAGIAAALAGNRTFAQAEDLEYIARLATAFAVRRLEDRAPPPDAHQDGRREPREIGKKIEQTMREVAVTKLPPP